MTVSQGIVSRTVSSNCGLKRRSESKTERHFTNSIPRTFPSPWTTRGPSEVCISSPSCWPSSISMRSAGISSRDSRQAMCTSVTPRRRAAVRATSAVTRKSSAPSSSSALRSAVRATSKATLPPPMTTTRGPISIGSPRFASFRNSRPFTTPGRSAPGMSGRRLPWRPAPRKNALNPCRRRSSSVRPCDPDRCVELERRRRGRGWRRSPASRARAGGGRGARRGSACPPGPGPASKTVTS